MVGEGALPCFPEHPLPEVPLRCPALLFWRQVLLTQPPRALYAVPGSQALLVPGVLSSSSICGFLCHPTIISQRRHNLRSILCLLMELPVVSGEHATQVHGSRWTPCYYGCLPGPRGRRVLPGTGQPGSVPVLCPLGICGGALEMSHPCGGSRISFRRQQSNC